jgi:hypothetical protein
MKIDAMKHHKVHKYTLSGLFFGCILLFAGIANMSVLENRGMHPLSIYIVLIPGMALILRSLRPPIGPLRTVAALAGGAMIGTVPMLLTSNDPQILWSMVATGLIGAALLGISFTPLVKAGT